MSSRWYPLYQIGNPQLRSFLPNFRMTILKPNHEDYPKNRVLFKVSMGMSRYDVKNYLERIYNVPVVNVRTFIKQGDTKLAPRKQYVVKDDDYKVAWVVLPKGMTFEYPDLFPKEKSKKEEEDEENNIKVIQDARQRFDNRRKYLPDVPGWFV